MTASLLCDFFGTIYSILSVTYSSFFFFFFFFFHISLFQYTQVGDALPATPSVMRLGVLGKRIGVCTSVPI